MENLKILLNEWFIFNEWSSHDRQPEKFTKQLGNFGTFKIYNNFIEFLKERPYLLEDSEGNDIDVDEILSNEKTFNDFLETQVNVSSMYDISYQQTNEAFLFGEADAPESTVYFESVSDIKGESDLIMFINEVLADMGTVTHYKGARNRYEVIEVELSKEDKLAKLVAVARENGHRIVAVNREYTAYCPVEGITFPNYEEALQRAKEASTGAGVSTGYRAQNSVNTIGTKRDWAIKYSDSDELAGASFLSQWITDNNETVNSDEAGEESGACDEFGVWYHDLELPADVKPLSDPLEEEAREWAVELVGE